MMSHEVEMSDERQNREDQYWLRRELDQIRADVNWTRQRVDEISAATSRFSPHDFVKREEFDPVKLNYVTKDEFRPIQRLIWTVAFVVISTVVVALLSLIFKTTGGSIK